MRIAAFDPGFGRLGYAVLEESRGAVRCLTVGCFETKKDTPHAERLRAVQTEAEKLLGHFAPEVVGIETLFFSKNVKTALKVAEARGVLLAAAAKQGVRIVECSPQQVKLAVTGYGKASKEQVQEMVKTLCRLKAVPWPDDAADALALAFAASRLHTFPT